MAADLADPAGCERVTGAVRNSFGSLDFDFLVLRRFPDFTIDETGAERHVSVNVRGLAKLPLVVQARAAA